MVFPARVIISVVVGVLGVMELVGCSAGVSGGALLGEPASRARAPANWSIGIIAGPDLSLLRERRECPNPRLTARDVAVPESDFVADPFLVREGRTWFLFFELLNHASGRGEIGVAESRDLCTWRYRGVALSEGFHLSYPHVFKVGQQYFMVPESKQAGEVRLYRAVSFPDRWQFDRTLIRGELSDATPLRWQGRWWIFANRAPYSLALFWANTLNGPYTEHAQSPLFQGDMGRARPAGRIIMRRGEVIRFVQDNREGYGKRVRMVRVTALSPHEYHEELLKPDPLLQEDGVGWNSFGMHHISAVHDSHGGWVAAVDGNSR